MEISFLPHPYLHQCVSSLHGLFKMKCAPTPHISPNPSHSTIIETNSHTCHECESMPIANMHRMPCVPHHAPLVARSISMPRWGRCALPAEVALCALLSRHRALSLCPCGRRAWCTAKAQVRAVDSITSPTHRLGPECLQPAAASAPHDASEICTVWPAHGCINSSTTTCGTHVRSLCCSDDNRPPHQ